MDLFGVINIDIVHSRELKNRHQLQDQLMQYLLGLNKEFRHLLAAPITMTLGDECQVILRQPEKCYFMINHFQHFFRQYNVSIYCGIGFGSISTKIYNDTRAMDGECFVKARESLQIVKKTNPYYNKFINSKDNRVFFNADSIPLYSITSNHSAMDEAAITTLDQRYAPVPSLNDMINQTIENNEILKAKVTPKQWDIIDLYKISGSYNNMINKGNGYSKSNISQKINASNFYVLERNNELIEYLLTMYCELRRKGWT